MFSNVHNLSEISFLIHSEFQIQQKKQDMTHHMLMVDSCTHQKNQFHPSFVALHVLPRPPCKIDIEYVTFKELYDNSQIWPPIIRFFLNDSGTLIFCAIL